MAKRKTSTLADGVLIYWTASKTPTAAMRLTEPERATIRSVVQAHFGAASAVWLFGSRLDDDSRGGDVDLYVEPGDPVPANLFLAREALRAELERRLTQPVDVVVRRHRPTAFMRQARAEGQRL
jgi:predicted nucleotidyltransferase